MPCLHTKALAFGWLQEGLQPSSPTQPLRHPWELLTERAPKHWPFQSTFFPGSHSAGIDPLSSFSGRTEGQKGRLSCWQQEAVAGLTGTSTCTGMPWAAASECKLWLQQHLGLSHLLHGQKLWTAQTAGLSLQPRLEMLLALPSCS